VASLKEPGRYSDGAGLNLQITPAGVKSWIFRYERGGKERWHGLGPVRDVSLAEARETAQECRRLLRQGIDPITHRQQAQVRGLTFEACVDAFLQTREKAWRNEKHRAQWKSTLKTYAYPVMGSLPVKDVEGSHILQALKPIWQEKPETARRLRGRLESVLDYAAAHGYREGENPARWKGHLSHLLGRVGDRTVKHHAATPFKDLPAFMDELKEREAAGARALELTILTAARTGEIIEAQWREFDLEEKVWTVPASRMKAKREHRVPLSPAAVDCLRALPHKGEYVFPGARAGKPISNMTMAEMLKGMGYGHFTVHGFRSTFRDWAAEKTSYANHVVEMALAHVIGDKVEAAYRRGDLFEKRRQLMTDWAVFCDSFARSG
jgi:integrase